MPVRIDGLETVLPPGWRMARPGRVRVVFGKPLTVTGDDYEAEIYRAANWQFRVAAQSPN